MVMSGKATNRAVVSRNTAKAATLAINRVHALLMLERNDEAAAEVERAHALNQRWRPGSPDAAMQRVNAGIVAMRRGRYQESRGFFERASAGATNDQVESVFRPRRRLPRIADTSVAHMTYRGAMTKPSLPALRGNDLDPSQTSPCSWCEHAEFIHAYDGPCLFSGC